MSKSSPATSSKSWPAKLFAFFASYELALFCLGLLTLLTFFGTIEQKTYGLYQTAEKYFDMDAFFLLPEWPRADGSGWKIPLPLPGTYWVSVLLFINMLCGGIIRARKGWKTVGVLISHFGILFMLVAGFVSSLKKKEGVMMVYEEERSDFARSYHDPTLEVFTYEQNERGTPWVVPTESLENLDRDDVLTAEFPQLPFSLEIRGYLPAAEMRSVSAPIDGADPTSEPVVDGFYLRETIRQPEEELNMQGCYVRVLDQAGEEVRRLLLWAGNHAPVSFTIDGQRYGILMPREIWPMPFEVELHKSVGDYWPGTRKARWFQSDITKIADGHREDYSIVMNKPMRHGGYTLYQARWDKPQDRAFSGFAIVRNPSDQWPKYSLYVVTFGLLVHFGYMLVRYLTNAFSAKKP
ncbi:MAG: cytochrome c biogenesis protein ResB [Verrucomicrobiales bacterium]